MGYIFVTSALPTAPYPHLFVLTKYILYHFREKFNTNNQFVLYEKIGFPHSWLFIQIIKHINSLGSCDNSAHGAEAARPLVLVQRHFFGYIGPFKILISGCLLHKLFNLGISHGIIRSFRCWQFSFINVVYPSRRLAPGKRGIRPEASVRICLRNPSSKICRNFILCPIPS